MTRTSSVLGVKPRNKTASPKSIPAPESPPTKRWLIPLFLSLLVVVGYLIHPTSSNPLRLALFLSYAIPPNPDTDSSGPTQYGKGPRDIVFVAFHTLVLSFCREFLMQRVLRPLAEIAGIRSRAKQARFLEQMYAAIYFGIFGSLGLYVMARTPVWYFRTEAMYINFPHKTQDALFKTYYLIQSSFWVQQMIVQLLMLEKRRKDFGQLVAHHCITLLLIELSYQFHFTYMGVAVYITHDISDFFLATSKTLKYINSRFVGHYLGIFIIVWIYLRHYINLRIIYSILSQFSTIGPYELNWETEQYKCLLSRVISFTLLGSLQAVNLFWLFLILRIAWRFLRIGKEELKDDRSEDDETEPEEEERKRK